MSFITYLKETRGEMKNVVWPSRRQVITFTILVIVIALVIGYYMGLFDMLFTKLLGLIIA